MLTKDLLRVSRRGGRYRPECISRDQRPLAAQLIGVYTEHVDRPRRNVDQAVEAIEREASDFKLVRGLAALLDREATFETVAPLPPERTRRRVFEAAESVGVATSAEREQAIEHAAEGLAVEVDAVQDSLYADRDCNQRLTEFDCRWEPATLIEQYNLSLAQTALFDATEVRITSDDPRGLISAVKRLRLMYEIEHTESTGTSQRTVVVTGPDRLFRRTRRYGTAFARLLRSVATSAEWELRATVDDRGTERELGLSERDVSVPGVEPLAEPSYDSGVESDFAARFSALDLDWELQREPDLLETGTSVMIPDFAFDYLYGDFRVYFEVMGFWTPEYVDKKLGQLERVEDVELIVAVDDSLGVGEQIESTDHQVVPYSGTVRVKDVVDVLREYEAELVDQAAGDLPAEFRPEEDVTTIEAIAEAYGVSTDAIESRAFPDHERLGQLLVRPAVLSTVGEELSEGLLLSEAEDVLTARGLTDTSAVLSAVDYRVEWDGLTGGVLKKR